MLLVNKDDIEKVARAIEASKSSVFGDEIGKDCTLTNGVLLVGMRLQLDYLSGSKSAHVRRKKVAAHLRSLGEGEDLQVLLRPLETARQPPLDDFGKELFRCRGAFRSTDSPINVLAEKLKLSKEMLLDKMLLVIHDALLLDLSEEWTRRKVANVPADETYELARWWNLGQNVGNKPLFDGILTAHKSTRHPNVKKFSKLF